VDSSSSAANDRPTAIIFDLFQTLVFFDASKLPVVTIGEKSRPTTIANLAGHLAEFDPALTPGAFLATIETVSHEIVAEKRATGREISSGTRFSRALRRATEGSTTALPERLETVVEALVHAHMGSLVGAVYCPENRHPLLADLTAQYQVGLLSNFDHGPTAHALLDRLDLTRWFRSRVVSDDVGFCKPSPEIFALACRQLGVQPSKTIFVGDSMKADVEGAARAGLVPIWINDSEEDPGPARAVIADVTELPETLRRLGLL
jgi:FMN phosphatase YigB (HAD superfamily)